MNTLANRILAVALLFSSPALAAEDTPLFEEVDFATAGGIEIRADLYTPHDDASTPFIVLFHQAGWSRGEYREIAPKLGELGFNCLAIDQRSGGEIRDVRNETHARATAKKLATTYVDALADLEQALSYARENHAQGRVLIWGSSYSAALVLKLAGDHPELIDGALAFAPGEYFQDLGKSADWIASSAAAIEDPVFITSARQEKANWWPIWQAIPGDDKVHFLPQGDGQHGSRALWEKFPDHSAYWQAVEGFLAQFSGQHP